MSIFTPTEAARPNRTRRILILASLTTVIAVATWAIATYAAGSESQPTRATPTQASVLSALTPRQRQYVLGIASLTPAQLRAAFGTDRPSSDDSVLATLTPRERHYVQAMASMNFSTLAAAFATGH